MCCGSVWIDAKARRRKVWKPLPGECPALPQTVAARRSTQVSLPIAFLLTCSRLLSAQTVYTSLALWLVKKQIDEAKERLTPQEIASQLNVVSLVEMREVPEVVFEAEPLDADLFNRFVLCRDESRPRSDGNYMPRCRIPPSHRTAFPIHRCFLCQRTAHRSSWPTCLCSFPTIAFLLATDALRCRFEL